MAAPIGNRYALGNTGGRPAHYETTEELRAAVIGFFDYCLENGVKATITGLALYLGFSSRASFDDYDERSDEFSYIIKRAKLAVENSYEQSGQTIDIFALKNMGWKDRTEQLIEGAMPVTWVEEKTYQTKAGE
jgi:hypothetical protein